MMVSEIEAPGAAGTATEGRRKATYSTRDVTMLAHPSTMRFWRENRRWRLLPYVKARWDGPSGVTGYVCDRDYRVIAFVRGGQLVRGARESLCGFYLHHKTAVWFWCPADGSSPAENDATLINLLRRTSAQPATSWVMAVGAA